MIAIGARFGWSPRLVEDLTLWEIVAFIDGYNRANADPEKPEAMTNEDFDALLAKHKVG